MMVFLLIIHATQISSTLNLISSKHYSVFTVMFLWTKQNPKSLAVKCHKWLCHALKVQDSGSTTVHLHHLFSWNSCQLSKRYKLQPSCTHTYTRACSSLHYSWTLPVWTTTLQTTGSYTRSASYSFTVSVWSCQVAQYKTVSLSFQPFPFQPFCCCCCCCYFQPFCCCCCCCCFPFLKSAGMGQPKFVQKLGTVIDHGTHRHWHACDTCQLQLDRDRSHLTARTNL